MCRGLYARTYKNQGSAGPEYSTLELSNSSFAGKAQLSIDKAGTSTDIILSPEQAIDLAEQLQAIVDQAPVVEKPLVIEGHSFIDESAVF